MRPTHMKSQGAHPGVSSSFCRRRKGQIQSQVLVYILAVVVLGLVLVFGYNAIQNMIAKQAQAEKLMFASDLKSAIVGVADEYGTVKVKTIRAPGSYREACFVNLDHEDAINSIPLTGYNSIIRAAVYSMKEENAEPYNVFLCPGCKTPEEQIYVGRLQLQDEDGADVGFLCVPVAHSSLRIRIQGLGDGAVVSPVSASGSS